jgi:nucleotide-binding universal stress UspA family protein
MKKIIVALDGLKYSDSAVQYAIQLTRQAQAHLVGIMLEDATYTSYKVYELITKNKDAGEKIKQYEQKDKEIREQASLKFAQSCRLAGINYSIHHDKNIALQDLLHESIYADLLVIDSKETLTHYDEKRPTRFIRDLLADVQCPVLVVPPKFKTTDKIIFLYDGAPSSVYAIKMFSYLFPFSESTRAQILSVKSPGQNLHMPDNRLMKELVKRYFPGAEYQVIKGLPEVEIIQTLKQLPRQMLVVLGAYRRGRVSRWFRESMADTLLKEMSVPLFIAHH